jgi:hypothetical protein
MISHVRDRLIQIQPGRDGDHGPDRIPFRMESRA